MEIHIARDGEQFGPFPPEEVRRQLAAGTLLATDLAWAQGAIEWVPLGSLPAMKPAPIKIGSAPQAAPWQSPSSPPVVVPAAYPAVRTSGAAVASMVLGIMAITFILPGISGIAAIICGHIARGKIRRSGGLLLGDGMALSGLITGYISLLLVLLVALLVGAIVFAGMALPFFGQAQMEGKRVQSMGNAKEIVVACQAYATEHQGNFPKTLDQLVPKYLTDQKTFIDPLSGPGIPMGYTYAGGTTKDPDDKVLLISKYQDVNGWHVLARVNGAVTYEKPPPRSLSSGAR